MPLSRVHLHPYGSFLMCYDSNKWEDAREGIIKGSIIVPKYCQMGSKGDSGKNWLENTDDYDVPDLPQEIVLPDGNRETIKVSSDSLTYDFVLNESDSIHCYL